ncbi:MAG: hypothetical protein CVV44_22965 [Spirochaetae bacterium HGW-Spirochaetae-1]|jgi:succinate dehydrogenase flavin-adding protein (antitoxin of CptAB toxin-antitoxin module)|nr:MAG: hypothetical protein CVV44_22965 [Spirochaetae bacterium HGW-Spirochaetae-1]
MEIHDAILNSPLECYNKYGFALIEAYNIIDNSIIEKYAIDWLNKILNPWLNNREKEFSLENYHKWWNLLNVDHNNLFRAANRHINPPENIKKKIINKQIDNFLKQIGIKKFKIWDEGLGWLAFRFIRPGVGDGYPFSRKEWGPAKNVISAWIPIIGRSESETLKFIPGSHVCEYERYLPNDSKFRSDEFRLVNTPLEAECFRPNLRIGQIILYHPRLIHTENVENSNITRLNLEFRIIPEL